MKPGYTPPEDVARYKNRAAEGWRGRPGGVVGAEELGNSVGGREAAGQTKSVGVSVSANARRRENARRKAAEANGETVNHDAGEGDNWDDDTRMNGGAGGPLEEKLAGVSISPSLRDQSTSTSKITSSPLRTPKPPEDATDSWRTAPKLNGDHKPVTIANGGTKAKTSTKSSISNPTSKSIPLPTSLTNPTTTADDPADEIQRKIRATLKKLRGITELKERMKKSGEKLSPDQLVKVGKEAELRRDLRKLGYEGDEEGEAA